MKKFSGFEELLHSFETDRPDAVALLAPGGQGPAPVSRAAFSAAVMEEAKRLARSAVLQDMPYETVNTSSLSSTLDFSGKHCLGILCDGTYECVKMIFASVLAGLQTVLLDENASDELLAAQIRETDIDSLWGDEELCEELQPFLATGAPGSGTTAANMTGAPGSGTCNETYTGENRSA